MQFGFNSKGKIIIIEATQIDHLNKTPKRYKKALLGKIEKIMEEDRMVFKKIEITIGTR